MANADPILHGEPTLAFVLTVLVAYMGVEPSAGDGWQRCYNGTNDYRKKVVEVK